MATGVLIIGIGKATRLLGYLALSDKAYSATIRLGISTVTDDAEGDVVTAAGAAGLTDADIEAAMARLRGEILQVPSAVSAIKVERCALICARSSRRTKSTCRPGRFRWSASLQWRLERARLAALLS